MKLMKQYPCRILIIVYALFMFHCSVSAMKMDYEPRSETFQGHETTHEHMGQVHFPDVIYDEFVSNVVYTEEPQYSNSLMGPVFNITHTLFDFFSISNASHLIPDYIARINSSKYSLGEKYEKNDWAALLEENKFLILLWILPLLLLIFIMPFVAIIYCCFCCWHCKQTCPPCSRDKLKRIIYSILLFVLILGLLLAFIITITSRKLMNRTDKYNLERMKRGTKDTCAFLEDVSLHLQHLFKKNFKQLEDHTIAEAKNAHNHILLDLVDTPDGSVLARLERILAGMKEASVIMRDITKTQDNLRFLVSLYRDLLRGSKRDLNTFLVSYCDQKSCHDMASNYMTVDTSKCLHLDEMPDSSIYLEVMQNASDKKLDRIVRNGIQRIKHVGDALEQEISPLIPLLKSILAYVRDQYDTEYRLVNDIIQATISDIHLRILHTDDSFEDINHRFGTSRQIFTDIACLVLLLVLIALIFGLIYGTFVRKTNAASNCMIFAVILILCVYSLITLMGLFYYMLGMVTYQATCNREPDLESEPTNIAPLTDVISACREDQHIVDLLKENNLYDVQRIRDINVQEQNDTGDVPGPLTWNKYSGNLTSFFVFELKEYNMINDTLLNLTSYQGASYTKILCRKLQERSLDSLTEDVISFLYRLHGKDQCASTSQTCFNAFDAAIDMKRLKSLEPLIYKDMTSIEQNVAKIDDIIVVDKTSFGETLERIINTIQGIEKFIKDSGAHFINTIGKNLTESTIENLVKFRARTISIMSNEVGYCKPLAYIQDPSVKFACRQLIDPINGLWVGLLLSSLLYLPILFIGHRLICLYKKKIIHKSEVVYLEPLDGCPTCTGAPYAPPPIVICSGNINESNQKNKRD